MVSSGLLRRCCLLPSPMRSGLATSYSNCGNEGKQHAGFCIAHRESPRLTPPDARRRDAAGADALSAGCPGCRSVLIVDRTPAAQCTRPEVRQLPGGASPPVAASLVAPIVELSGSLRPCHERRATRRITHC